MDTVGKTTGVRGRLSTWVLAGVGGVLALAAGFVLPHALGGGPSALDGMNSTAAAKKEPDQPADPKKVPVKADSSAATESKDKAKMEYSPPAWPEAPDTSGLVSRFAMGTVLVLALCGATLWMAKRWLGGPQAKHNASGQLQIVETLPLGRRCLLHLVKAGKHQILIGVDQAGLKTIVSLKESFESALEEIPTERTPIEESEMELASARDSRAI